MALRREFSLSEAAPLVDMSEDAFRAFLQDKVKAADRANWSRVEGLSVKVTRRQEWRVRFRACWFEGEYLGIWLNLPTFAQREGCVEGSLRTALNKGLSRVDGCDEGSIGTRRFRRFAGRWKVLIALVADWGTIDERGRRGESPPHDDLRERATDQEQGAY